MVLLISDHLWDRSSQNPSYTIRYTLLYWIENVFKWTITSIACKVLHHQDMILDGARRRLLYLLRHANKDTSQKMSQRQPTIIDFHNKNVNNALQYRILWVLWINVSGGFSFSKLDTTRVPPFLPFYLQWLESIKLQKLLWVFAGFSV